MKRKIRWADLKTKEGFASLIDDVVMLVIVVVNLIFVIFDWHFTFQFFRDFLQNVAPNFFEFYRDRIHPNFLLYDSFFVTIFITELVVRWGIAIKNRTYARWWFFPFIHWYDVLGCIPLGAFIWLRLFRVIGITIRLHMMGVINLKSTYIYRQIFAGYQFFVEEVTDRVLVKLVEALQREIKRESEASGSTVAEAVKPNQSELAKVLSDRVQRVAEDNYKLYREDMKKQIEEVIKDGFEQSEEMKKVENLPLVGSQITKTLEKSLSDITFQLADSMASKLASDEIARLVEEAINTTIDAVLEGKKELKSAASEKDLNHIVKDILDRALQRLKEDIGKDGKRKQRIPEPVVEHSETKSGESSQNH